MYGVWREGGVECPGNRCDRCTPSFRGCCHLTWDCTEYSSRLNWVLDWYDGAICRYDGFERSALYSYISYGVTIVSSTSRIDRVRSVSASMGFSQARQTRSATGAERGYKRVGDHGQTLDSIWTK